MFYCNLFNFTSKEWKLVKNDDKQVVKAEMFRLTKLGFKPMSYKLA